MPSKRSRIARLTAAITAVTALVVAVALFAEALIRLGNQTEPIVCKLGISLPWCPISVGTSGWMYIGTRIGGQWRTSLNEGNQPALTIETNALPTNGGIYVVSRDVHLRRNAPEQQSNGAPDISDCKGTIPIGSRVQLGDIRELNFENPSRIWIFAYATIKGLGRTQDLQC